MCAPGKRRGGLQVLTVLGGIPCSDPGLGEASLGLEQFCPNRTDCHGTTCVGTSPVSVGCSVLLEEPAWRTQNCSDEHTACVLGNRSMLLFCKEENVLMLHCSDILQTLQVFLIFEHILQQEEEQFSIKMRFRKW